jgi:hypothetical protein
MCRKSITLGRGTDHAQRCGVGAERADGDYSGLNGRKELHRAWPRQRAKLLFLQPRRRASDEPNGGKKRYTLSDHIQATSHVECRKDNEVIDETPMAYKDIDAVMAAQSSLVEIVHTLRQVVCKRIKNEQ